MLLAAATVRAAEFEVSRSHPLSLAEGHISKMLIAENSQIACYQRGIIVLFYEAATARGVTFDGPSVLRRCWGVNPGALRALNCSQLSFELTFVSLEIGRLAREYSPYPHI